MHAGKRRVGEEELTGVGKGGRARWRGEGQARRWPDAWGKRRVGEDELAGSQMCAGKWHERDELTTRGSRETEWHET